MTNLAHTQSAFAKALLDRTVPVPAEIRGASRRRADRRFAVYRNNVAAGLANALAARFPVVKRLVSDEFFRAMAHVYAAADLPRSPVMLYYGETFPGFIDDFEPARPIPYLGDIARIEMARGLAYHAADETPLEPQAFAALPPEALAEARVRLHPSLSIITSLHPIYSIWHVNRDPVRFTPPPPWGKEAVLVARPRLKVRTQSITYGDAAFIRALAVGSTLAEAVLAAQQAVPRFCASESLAVLIGARVVVGFGAQACPMQQS
jgi:Putative DNA-binding domain